MPRNRSARGRCSRSCGSTRFFFRRFLGGACKFYPSCSNYAQEAIVRHGARRGTVLALKRLGRCRPFTKGGFDPVPDAEDMDAAWLRSERLSLEVGKQGVRAVNEMSDQVRGIVFVCCVAADSFCLGTFLQAARSSAAIESSANFGSSCASKARSTFPRRPGSSQEYFGVCRRRQRRPRIRPRLKPAQRKPSWWKARCIAWNFRIAAAWCATWKLKKYFDDQKPPHPLDLVNAQRAQQLGWPFSLVLSDPQLEAQANSALYEVTPARWSDAGSGARGDHLPLERRAPRRHEEIELRPGLRNCRWKRRRRWTASRCPSRSPGAADLATRPSTKRRSSSPCFTKPTAS